jgi:hypothetical protein
VLISNFGQVSIIIHIPLFERIKPYESPEDERLIWKKDTFLKFLEDWKSSIQAREGPFTAAEREKLFLSYQMYEGFKISANSRVEVIKFLLSEGFSYVLTERFMQDVIDSKTILDIKELSEEDQITLQQNSLAIMI